MLNLNKLNKEYEEENVLYFNNDDDFSLFCMNPELKTYSRVDNFGNTVYQTYYDFSDDYLNAVNSGMYFCVKDENSHVNKDGILGYKNTSKCIDNVKRYYGD